MDQGRKEPRWKEAILILALERSDIDIAVSGVKAFDALEEEIEEIPTLYIVDLLNMDTCRNELILEDIRKYGRKI